MISDEKVQIKGARRLARFMREGAKKRPQARGDLFKEMFVTVDGKEKLVIGSCALGAAYEGATGKLPPPKRRKMMGNEAVQKAVNEGLDIYKEVPDPADPTGIGVKRKLAHVIEGLNDQKRWTREQIADWLDTLEEV